MGRYGGEEFVLFLKDATREEALRIGNRLCAVTEVAEDSGQLEIRFTMSAGAASARAGASLSDLLNLADAALYQAKQRGRACMVIWQAHAEEQRAG